MTAPLPGIRPGQIWEQIKSKTGRVRNRIQITGGGMGDVYCNLLGADGKPQGHNRSLPREGFEDRYRLISEGDHAVCPGGHGDQCCGSPSACWSTWVVTEDA